MSPLQIVALLLGIPLLLSIAGNAYFWHERDSLIQREATVTQLQADTKAAASACTASVDSLSEKSENRGKRLESVMLAIAPRVAAEQRAALQALQARPDDPKDLCGSLSRFLTKSILEERKGEP